MPLHATEMSEGAIVIYIGRAAGLRCILTEVRIVLELTKGSISPYPGVSFSQVDGAPQICTCYIAGIRPSTLPWPELRLCSLGAGVRIWCSGQILAPTCLSCPPVFLPASTGGSAGPMLLSLSAQWFLHWYEHALQHACDSSGLTQMMGIGPIGPLDCTISERFDACSSKNMGFGSNG